ncbi:hypothetical protein EDB85DRAFT_617500 [Lactarius pseudohatsudake]|nr:hypothetical protein EDB85DRAFT_617500 [Lactarius pseudohatsudake]
MIWVACPGPSSIYFCRLIESSSRNPPHFDEAENSLETSDPLAPQDKTRGGAGIQSLPAWLHDVFREEIGGRYRALERPLVGPSDIRAKYMSALQKHVTTDKCTFCPGVHALRGEKYIAELERALTQTRNRTTLEFLKASYIPASTISAAIATSRNSEKHSPCGAGGGGKSSYRVS